MSLHKISPMRLADFDGPRRKKPPVRAINRAIGTRMQEEAIIAHNLLVARDASEALCHAVGVQPDGILVATNFYHPQRTTYAGVMELPAWSDLTEYMVLQMGFVVALGLGSYAFSMGIHPRYLEQGMIHRDLAQRIQKRMATELAKAGLGSIPYAYVIEGRKRCGKIRNTPHLHGYVIADRDQIEGFKLAMGQALLSSRGRRGMPSTAWHHQELYDFDPQDGRGRGRWVNYISKNVRYHDARFQGRRIHIARDLLQAAREMWDLLREEHDGEFARIEEEVLLQSRTRPECDYIAAVASPWDYPATAAWRARRASAARNANPNTIH